MWSKAPFLIMLLCCALQGIAQQSPVPFVAPVANPFEARIGSMYQVGAQKLRLDIGTQLELIDGRNVDQRSQWSAGVGFQTWTRLRSEANFKFPVETVDYWFGVHGMYALDSSWQVRLRVAHISSHLADGLADSSATLHPKQFVYSREFAEALIGYPIGPLRPYAGLTLVWATKPDDPSSVVPQAGIDVREQLTSDWWLIGGYDVRLVGLSRIYTANHAAQLGLLYQTSPNKGIWMGLYGYHGKSMHGMFYRGQDSYLACGFQVFW